MWAVLVPQAMAYAALAGVPPVYGLYAACAGLLLYALLGTSRQLSVGPSSGMAILSAATVASIAGGNVDRYLNLTALLALMVGVILAVAGIARLGFIAEFLAKPVLAGYTVGLALVILVGQLSSLLGIPSGSGNFFQVARNVLSNLDNVSGWTVAVGLGSLALILVLQTIAPRLPAALIVVVAGIVAARALDLSSHGVAELGKITAAMPSLSIPSMSFADIQSLITGGLGLSLLAYAESIGAARTFAARHGYEVDANRELIALGAANIGSGLIQGFAIDASFSRTSVADGAGQRTQLAGLLNLGLLLLTLALLTPFFADLPKATLGAIVIAAVLPLLKQPAYAGSIGSTGPTSPWHSFASSACSCSAFSTALSSRWLPRSSHSSTAASAPKWPCWAGHARRRAMRTSASATSPVTARSRLSPV